MASSAWQFLLQQGDESLRAQVGELSPAQVRRLLRAFADGLVDIASTSGTTSAATSQTSSLRLRLHSPHLHLHRLRPRPPATLGCTLAPSCLHLVVVRLC